MKTNGGCGGLFCVLSRYLLVGAEENREQSLRIAAGRDLNRTPRKYKSRALTDTPTYSVIVVFMHKLVQRSMVFRLVAVPAEYISSE
jgi:hypothetical protein